MADDIKAELEWKREKLRQLREEKKRRQAANRSSNISLDQSTVTNTSITSIDDVDEVLRSLGIVDTRRDQQTNILDQSITETDEKESDRQKLKVIFNALKVDIMPAPEVIVYSKDTQTINSEHDTNETLQWDDDELFTSEHILPFEENSLAVDIVHEARRGNKPSLEERQRILSSVPLNEFVSDAGRILERILASNDDEFTNYRHSLNRQMSSDEDDTDEDPNKLLRQVHVIQQPNKGTIVNSIDWSTTTSELVLAAYAEQGKAKSVVHVWNAKHGGVKTPEFSLHCHQSPVTTAIFCPFHRSLVFGGTYSGQIIIWDLRTGKGLPVQRSQPSGAAHVYPVFAIRAVGSPTAYSLVSVSTEGKMCTWRPDMITKPSRETLNLLYKPTTTIAPTCLDFPYSEVNKFVLGSEECLVYQGVRSQGIVSALEGHNAHVTAVSCHPFAEWSDLLLSSSLDWTVALWSTKEMEQVFSFNESTHYVLDVQWCPFNPSVFVTANSGGRVSLWDLTRSIEGPSATVTLPNMVNRLAWQKTNRSHLAVGTNSGSLYLYTLNESIYQPRVDNGALFNMAIRELCKMRNDQSSESDIMK